MAQDVTEPTLDDRLQELVGRPISGSGANTARRTR